MAWQAGYLHTLSTHGIRFETSDRIVGTSAGSIVASALAGGKLSRLHTEVSLLARAPALVAALAPASKLRPSQEHALGLFLAAADAEPSTLRTIGHAALSAVTPRPEVTQRNISLVLARPRWTSEALHITCVDAYSGERCVVTKAAQTPISRAVAASSAVPGVFAPQPIGDRRCMDGGVSGTGVHLDLFAGSGRTLVLALTDGSDLVEGAMTTHPGSSERELAALQGTGTDVLLRVPESVDMMELMEPKAVPAALAMGVRQASADVGLLSAFWGTSPGTG